MFLERKPGKLERYTYVTSVEKRYSLVNSISFLLDAGKANGKNIKPARIVPIFGKSYPIGAPWPPLVISGNGHMRPVLNLKGWGKNVHR